MVSGVSRTNLFMQEIARNSPAAASATAAPAATSQLDLDAQNVSVELSRCSKMLTELSALARKRSIYVDHTAEIERLTSQVKEGITIASNGVDAFAASIGRMRHKNDRSYSQTL